MVARGRELRPLLQPSSQIGGGLLFFRSSRSRRSPTVADHPFSARLSALRDHRSEGMDMRATFASDPERFRRFSLTLDDMLLDWSKCAVTAETMELLVQLADAAPVSERRDAMLAGEKITVTEDRAVLHTALCTPATSCVRLD